MKTQSLFGASKQAYLASTIVGLLAVFTAIPGRAQAPFFPGPNPIPSTGSNIPQELRAGGGPQGGIVNGPLTIDSSSPAFANAIKIEGNNGVRTLTNNSTIQNLLSVGDASRAIRYGGNGDMRITVTNNTGALIRSVSEDAFQINPNTVTPPRVTNATFVNSGTIKVEMTAGSSSEALDWGDVDFTGEKIIRNLTSGSRIESLPSHAIKLGSGASATVTNAGTIEGGIHGIQGEDIGATITNQPGGVIRGKNGSGVNLDTIARMVTITNNGIIEGLGGTDPDGVDVDFKLVQIYNSGTISGLGTSSTAEGISIGGGNIDNLTGGLITGGLNGILANDSQPIPGPALGITTIKNFGVIKSSGLISPSWAIQLTGDWADTVANNGQIEGTIDMGGGDDMVTITGGNNVGVSSPAQVLGNIIGGANATLGDTITFNVPNGQTFTYESPYQISGFEKLIKTGEGILDLRKAVVGSVSFDIQQGTLYLNESQTLAGLNIGSGATLELRESAAMIAAGPLDTNLSNGLQIHATTSMTRLAVELIDNLDVTNNALIVQKDDSVNSTLEAITARVAGGLSWEDFNYYWIGEGINSSTAAADTNYLSAVGVVDNSVLEVTTFEGVGGLTGNEILVRYTLYGDADLDGAITGADYSMIDNGYALGLTGWVNGDFNYDGVIDGVDYGLIDSSYFATH